MPSAIGAQTRAMYKPESSRIISMFLNQMSDILETKRNENVLNSLLNKTFLSLWTRSPGRLCLREGTLN